MTSVESPEPHSIEQWSVRRMGLGDLGFVVSAHRRSFPTNVMSRLGRPLLCRYYRTFLDGPEAWAQVAERDGHPEAFLVGVLDTRHHRQLVLRHHGAALVGATLVAAFRNPVLLARLVTRRVRRAIPLGRSRRVLMPQQAEMERVAVLSHLVVAPEHRGQGIGTALVADFVEAARSHGASRIALATLSGDEGASAFYHHLGWECLGSGRTADGRSIQLFELKVSAAGEHVL